MRLIDSDNLVPDICDAETEYGTKPVHFSANAIDLAPTVDAVPVVRCEKCVAHGNCFAEHVFVYTGIENPYCCAGDRKEGAV